MQCRLSGSYQSVFLLGSLAFLTTDIANLGRHELLGRAWGVSLLFATSTLALLITSPPLLRMDRQWPKATIGPQQSPREETTLGRTRHFESSRTDPLGDTYSSTEHYPLNTLFMKHTTWSVTS